MNKFTPALLAMTTLLWACSTTPTQTSLLDQTRSEYSLAKNNPSIAKYAPLELKQAGEALDQANAAASKKESIEVVDGLAYVAKQKIALMQSTATQKSAEADMANSSKQRDQVRLEQRTNEANQATASAVQAKADLQDAQRETQVAKADASSLLQQLSDLKAKNTERGIVITLGDVLFASNQSQLTAAGVATAQKLADVLQKNPQRKVLIEGFTDNTGTVAHNQMLSTRRATAVSAALQQLGIASERIAVQGYGESFPVASNATSQNRQLNRRVEIVLSDDNGKINPR
ncbi:OmpA family protein [Deefgea rivuli]|uniref:OmpA family protein n=1 Tax=Deefgea rivuli TaxID=400948 RepID=UPI000488DFC3|nr:OmpA family protein [Deefgea rivuli]